MIPESFIEQWRIKAPWQTLAMIEQDLVISRALVELYDQPKIKSSLAFRGGTALNKLFVKTPARYSEDIDLVQITSEPIGSVLSCIRSVLDLWLGEPKRKFTEKSVKLFYRYTAIDKTSVKLKIEINTTEHSHILPLQAVDYDVQSEWFKGAANILTYNINELMGSKLRALYQRRKGRDLFDLWHVLKQGLIEPVQVVSIFNRYNKYDKQTVSRAMFEQNLYLKELHKDFLEDISVLLLDGSDWDFNEAIDTVRKHLINKLEGDSWKG
ncbi:MAG: nucleotidyl transferase AbiEii/AbiGii toxin family protein [Gammaproteobacteria bacterium]|nr:nucleotidyl transferase AbiEii/AbiGii toxin family protein [Gammaproteobacteria bacterium]